MALSGESLPVEVDSGQIEQVLFNLAINAGDAMPGGGLLTIRTGAGGAGRVWFEVVDTGAGIGEDLLPRIFDPFFTTKEAGKGTGLGLSVVKRIIEHHGGSVEVRSRIGAGTNFRVWLPIAAPGEAAGERPEQVEEAMPVGRGERILLVEDEDAVRQTLGRLLECLGYRVVTASGAEEAEALAEETPFDVLLTDLTLPGKSGSELAEYLTALWPDLQVVLMSGYFDGETDLATKSGRAFRLLQKPFDMEILARYLRDVLSPGG